MRWLRNTFKGRATGRERRKFARHAAPLVAYYWSGGASVPYPVENISPDGIFIRTPDRWRPGTILQLRLQEDIRLEHGGQRYASSSLSVLTVVVREEGEGMAMSFVFDGRRQRRQFEDYLSAVFSRHAQKPEHSAPACESGQSLVEFALILPMLFLLIVNAINFGAFFFAWITVANAARSAGEYAIMAGATVGAPTPATSTQIYNVVTSDISSLLNRSSLAVRVCTNNGGTIACTTTGTGTFTNPAADTRTEASQYVMAWVDVLYTYQPMIPLFDFSGLQVHATLPATVIHRQAVMRMLQ